MGANRRSNPGSPEKILFRFLVCVLGLGVQWSLPVSVSAHDAKLGIAAKNLTVKIGNQPKKRRFQFLAKSHLVGLGHDPRTVPTWILIRGYGNEGGASGRILLDPMKWKPLGRNGNIKGYKYVDREGTRGGVKKVVLKPGRLLVAAGGVNWPWEPAGPQDSVWVYFGIEDESLCANFGGKIKKNEAGHFRATDATPPVCPASMCGNAEIELGEDCDDGNLVEDDGCTSQCEVGTCVGESFASTFEGIQERVFEQNGCTNSICHGLAPGQGDLQLSENVSYDQMLDVASAGSGFDRVEPSSPRTSSLYLKLLKGVEPDTDIPGAAMPSGLAPLHADLIEAVRLWIEQGAPATGTVPGTEALLGGCFPDPVPISIAPLEVPALDEGFQLEMPGLPLPAQTELEVCFATYYDFTDVVPAQFKDPTNPFFYSSQAVTRQDPHSHHLVIMDSLISPNQIHHASFGSWTCIGGPQPNASCDPLDTDSCGSGICRSSVRSNTACIGFGPPGGATAAVPDSLGGAGNGQASLDLAAGLYRKLPLKAIVYWNPHAFNLTSQGHTLKAYLNLLFTDDLQHEVEPIRDIRWIYLAAGQAPYTRQTYCRDITFPQGTQVVSLNSHTHQRGEAFWVIDPNGNRIYESFIYSDPVNQIYDPPLAFDSADPAERTVTYCATFNNGLFPDGTPNPATVRRRSVTPPNALPCPPTACTEGRVGEACAGVSDHASCDSVIGAGDGFCDACAITAGVSTEDEMFVLTGWSYEVAP